jgi:hydroxymethylbilane synthase
MSMIRIGTRGSRLALWQARSVALLLHARGHATEVVCIDTSGDQDIQTPLWMFDGVGVFTAAVDQTILDGTVDIGVHSMKDVPTRLAEGLQIAAVLERGSHRDVVLTRQLHRPDDTDRSPWVVASSSRRRAAQWLERFPHDTIVPLRGSIQTRLGRLTDGDTDAVIMAEAALERLQVQTSHSHVLDWMVPAPAQGAICVVVAVGSPLHPMLQTLDDPASRVAVEAERAFLRALDGGCRSAIGAHASITGTTIDMVATVHQPDGRRGLAVRGSGPAAQAMELVGQLVQQARDLGAVALIEVGREV